MRSTYPILLAWITLLPLAARAGEVEFNRDIRPLLAAKCFACHGPDPEERQADLRLDKLSAVVANGIIVPGKPDASELVHRIFSDDPDEAMPPRDFGESLTDKQRELLRSWIAAGANFQQHWAFVPPARPTPPEVKDAAWIRNEIDRFVLARLESAGLRPSPAADRYTLVRRVYLDLIGLPPSPDEADAFVNDHDPQAYEQLVDRLLGSQQYGERWARLWLDLARYADTNGYEKDRPRSIWPYRDWVIRALNDNMPFDQFTIEQIAGDMLPNATLGQRIATGFHRNTMLNEEGGIDPLEFRFYAMVDRVATTGIVWMGLTTGCAQCHSHKYDPITQTDYYRLFALLNNADEPDLFVSDPAIAAQRQQLKQQIAALEAELPKHFPAATGDGPLEARRLQQLDRKFAEWIAAESARAVDWKIWRPTSLASNLPKLEVLPDGSIFSSGDITKRDVFTLKFPLDALSKPITAIRLEVLPDDRLPARGPGRAFYEGRKGDFFLSEITGNVGGMPVKFVSPSHSFGKISIGNGTADAANVIDGEGSTGWSTATREGQPHQLVLNLAEPLPAQGELTLQMLFERHFAASLGRFRFSAAAPEDPAAASPIPVDVESSLARDTDDWNDAERARLKRYFLSVAPELAEPRKQIESLRKKMPEFPTTMALQERPADNPRQTFRHHRGEYLSTREALTPGVPAAFSGGTLRPTNRLEFARWLVSPQNPLVARVTVNRAWRAFFGFGLVRTSGDFGTQSDPPTHPQLLDWLASDLVDQKWSLKRLHRTIVTSATYRQQSIVTPELARIDPQNRLLARGPRHRIDAEMVRDIMLKSSGLLSAKMFGPSVYPPQPASVTALAYGNTKWPTSTGEDRYRRSLYTFSKRTAPFAAYAVFDSPSGEECVAKRNRSNTPLQALTLLNDELFLEMARALAKRVQAEQLSSDRDTASSIFRHFLTRPPLEDELATLLRYQQKQLARLASGELDAAAIGGPDATPESAAWVMVARVVMNLDETITKQ